MAGVSRDGMRRLHRAPLLALVNAILLAAALPLVASASNGATIVRGVQLAAGTCEDGGYRMTGALDGCWWIDTFEVATSPDKHNYRATGTEHFRGWFGSLYGTFYTTFEFTSKTDGPWADGSPEIHGRCHHPVIGGEGDFAGARGEISFRDVVDVDPPYYPYWGNLQLSSGTGVVGTLVHMAGADQAMAVGC